jgi:hypothetical protein
MSEDERELIYFYSEPDCQGEREEYSPSPDCVNLSSPALSLDNQTAQSVRVCALPDCEEPCQGYPPRAGCVNPPFPVLSFVNDIN